MPINIQTKRITSVDYIVVHCSASKPSMNANLKMITEWHIRRGFLTVGYHYVIDRDGKLEFGRPELVQGAHVQGFNHCSIGICLSGGIAEDDPLGKRAEQNFTDAQYETLKTLLVELHGRYPAAVIQGHRDFPNVHKDCPSFDVRSWLTAINLNL